MDGVCMDIQLLLFSAVKEMIMTLLCARIEFNLGKNSG